MLFNNKIDRYMDGGMNYMDAYNLASQAVTVPGSSEHQVGLAIDIITDGYSSLDEGFGNTAAGKWLADNSYKFGFILRYPAGKENRKLRRRWKESVWRAFFSEVVLTLWPI